NQYYALGIDEETNTYVLSVVMEGVCMETRYFRLTQQEFENYPENQAQITQLALSCCRRSNGIENNFDRFLG
ncbi:MAG TPA: hypothetical protein VHO69_17435, partial [Phototrophicaceae bacterium]|nr:hypothetical protein [Phototrophicaceae bacterium]